MAHETGERGVDGDDAVEERLAQRRVIGDVQAEHRDARNRRRQHRGRRLRVEPDVELRRGGHVARHARAAPHENQVVDARRQVRPAPEGQRQIGQRTERHERHLVRVALYRLDEEGHGVARPRAGRGEAPAVRRPHPGLGREGALEPDGAPFGLPAGRPRRRVDERRVRAQMQRYVRRTGQLEQVEHVLGALRHGVVAGDDGDPEHIEEVAPLQQHRERRRVVVEDGRVRVDEEPASHWIMMRRARRRRQVPGGRRPPAA